MAITELTEDVNSPVVVHPTVLLRVEECRPNTWNPNEQSDEEFALLVETIRAEGFSVPLNVCPLNPPEENVKYEIIGGEHRWSAARVLGMEFVPGIVWDDFDTDRRKMLTVKLNVLHGNVNPVKFTKMFNALLAKYQDTAILQKLMGFATEAEFKKLFREVKQALPPEFAKKLAESKEEIQTVADLSLALNRLFGEYGNTLPFNIMIFSYGGRENLMLRCSAKTWALVKGLADRAVAENADANVLFAEVLLRGTGERGAWSEERESVERESEERGAKEGVNDGKERETNGESSTEDKARASVQSAQGV